MNGRLACELRHVNWTGFRIAWNYAGDFEINVGDLDDFGLDEDIDIIVHDVHDSSLDNDMHLFRSVVILGLDLLPIDIL